MSEDKGGDEMMDLIRRLYPICRSITGAGVRSSLDVIDEWLPLQRHEVPTGTPVFDWTIPNEWNIRSASICSLDGRRVVDFADHNLHVLNYSIPVRKRVSRQELMEHVHTLPDHPDWIPYRTSYYKDAWGFCMTHRQASSLTDDEYDVEIDASLEPGALSLAEVYLPGESEQEILFSTHICHPSLCNDNLTGIAAQVALFRWLADSPRYYSYRAVFVPGTIGSLAWLWLNRSCLEHIKAGLVVTGLADPGDLTYKLSRRGNAWVDQVVRCALRDAALPANIRPFSPYGYDERQYCSPGFNLPMGRLTRTPFGEYPEYHTSGDNLNFISQNQLEGSLEFCKRVVRYLEGDRCWMNQSPFGEPQLGKRGLYDSLGGFGSGPDEARMALLWLLNLSDGNHSTLDIAEHSGIPVETLIDGAQHLVKAGLIKPYEENAG